MGCGTGCAKTILIGVNVIFFLAGAGILGGGLYVRLEPNIQTYAKAAGIDILTNELFTAAYVLIAFGAVTLIVGFCGCYGAIKESKCALGFYIAFILVIIGAEVAGGVLVITKKNELLDELQKEAVKYLQTDYAKIGGSVAADKAWDAVMETLNCCGYTGISDFNNSALQAQSPDIVPRSCCKDIDKLTDCQTEARNKVNDPTVLRNQGCKDALIQFLTDQSTLLLGIAGGVAGFELIVLLMAICVCCGIEDDKY